MNRANRPRLSRISGSSYASKLMSRAGDGSTLTLDFTTGSLDSRLIFTRASANATFINVSGVLTSAGTDIARFDHDPSSLALKGLLVEGTATNICLNGSMAYTSTSPTSWARGFSQCNVSSVSSTTFPGQKAWSIAASAINQRDYLEQTIALAANTTYIISVYVEAVTGTTATFAYMTSLPSGASSNTISNPSSAGRLSFTVTVGATAGNGALRIGIGTAVGTGVSADASVRFSHVQVETGTIASSYILTSTTTETRAADFCRMTGTNFSSWYQGGTQGTFYADWFGGVRAGASGSTNRTVLSTDDVSTKHLHLLQTAAAGNLRVADFGGTNNVTTANTLTSGARTKGAFGYNGSSASVCLNGGTVATGSSLSFSVAPTWLVIGATSTNGTSLTDANVVLNNSIRQIKYWPTRLADGTLQGLTT
jgi:hypothetical protein